MKQWKKFLVVCLLTGAMVGATAAVAQAWTFNQAFDAAWNKAIWWCQNYQTGDPWYWSCYQANISAPSCHGTGVNEAGKTQWWCYMYWVQKLGGVNQYRSCQSQVNYDPYGKIVYGILNSCQTGIVAARDHA